MELPTRELQVLRLLAEGLNNAEVAERLSLSVPTVKQYIRFVLIRLGAKSTIHAVAIALRRKLII